MTGLLVKAGGYAETKEYNVPINIDILSEDIGCKDINVTIGGYGTLGKFLVYGDGIGFERGKRENNFGALLVREEFGIYGDIVVFKCGIQDNNLVARSLTNREVKILKGLVDIMNTKEECV